VNIGGSSLALYTQVSRTRLPVPVQRSRDADRQQALAVPVAPVRNNTASTVQGELLQRSVGSYETTQSYLAGREPQYSSSPRYMVSSYITQARSDMGEGGSGRSIDYYV